MTSKMSDGDDRFDYSGYKRDLDEFIKAFMQGEGVVRATFEESRTLEELKKSLVLFNRINFRQTGVLLHGLRIQVELLQSIDKLVDALPDRREFDEVRREMKGIKNKVRQTLQPLKDMIEDAKKRTERGDDVYG